MYKLNVYFRKKMIATHWYTNKEECLNAQFALHNHPHFSYKTVVEHRPNAYIGYEADKS